MTPDDLRAIVARAGDHDGHGRDDDSCWMDRGVLLALVRRLVEPFPDGCPPKYDHLCQWCGYGDEKVNHDADCAWLVAQWAKS